MSAFQGPLHELVANAHGNAARVRELLDSHPQQLQERFAEWNETPMEAAAHTGSREIALELLARGARPTHAALAMLGRAEELRELLAREPQLAHTPGAHGIGLLFHAALSGDPGTLEAAWQAGAREGLDHAVHGALHAGSEAALAWLLQHGADVQATDWQGRTPAQVARERGQEGLLRLLRARSA